MDLTRHQARLQLMQLHADLSKLVDRDPDQEVNDLAVQYAEVALMAARNLLGTHHPVVVATSELISHEWLEAGEPIRAANLLVVVGQLLASLPGDPIRVFPSRRTGLGHRSGWTA
jgi:hypothetical protein